MTFLKNYFVASCSNPVWYFLLIRYRFCIIWQMLWKYYCFFVFIGRLCISFHEMSVQIFFSIFMLQSFSLVLIGSSSLRLLNTCICIIYTFNQIWWIYIHIYKSVQIYFYMYIGQITSLVAQKVKSLPVMKEIRVQSLGWEDPLEKEIGTH